MCSNWDASIWEEEREDVLAQHPCEDKTFSHSHLLVKKQTFSIGELQLQSSQYPPSPFSISFLEQRTSPVSVIAPTARWRCRQLEAEESKKAVQELEAILEDAKLYEDAFSMESASDTFSLSGASEASSLLSEEEEGVFTALTSMLLFQNDTYVGDDTISWDVSYCQTV